MYCAESAPNPLGNQPRGNPKTRCIPVIPESLFSRSKVVSGMNEKNGYSCPPRLSSPRKSPKRGYEKYELYCDESDILAPRAIEAYVPACTESCDEVYVQPWTRVEPHVECHIPTYLGSRSIVDHLGFSTDSSSGDVRGMANNAYTNSAIEFRTTMQESLMRRRNAELAHQRLYPISTAQRL